MDLLVLMTEQLRTQRLRRSVQKHRMGRNTYQEQRERRGFIWYHLVIELAELALQVKRARVGELGKNLQVSNQLSVNKTKHIKKQVTYIDILYL